MSRFLFIFACNNFLTYMRGYLLALIMLLSFALVAQEPAIQTKQDTTTAKKENKSNPFNTGFYPIGFFDLDLRYIIKYNNYEGIRLGVGGVTNDRLSEKYRLGGYLARGFKDKDMKFGVGGSVRLNKENNTWVNVFYKDDIQEIGKFNFLTDDRVYSVFEPRLVNVTQFYKEHTIQSNIQAEFLDKILAEVRVSRSRVTQIEDYQFFNDGTFFDKYRLAEISTSFRISPRTDFFTTEDGRTEYYDGLPKISAQVTQGIKGVLGSDFNYTKFGLKLDYYVKRTNLSSTNFLIEGNYAFGDVPLTHLYHAYPNAPTKDEILQRFSVAGRRSFETMYFGEFFSDQLVTLQVKHSLRRFNIANRFKPELIFITRHALGDMSNPEQHIGLPFNTLNEVYNESGFELNKLIFGFGLSTAYRYGFYNLPDFEDNISVKFTFYAKF